MKYIIVDEMGIEVPIVFCELLKHNEVAGDRKVISAGFCAVDDQKIWYSWGESVSLKIRSRWNDNDVIQKGMEMRL